MPGRRSMEQVALPVNHEQRRRALARQPSHPVPTVGDCGLGELEQPASVQWRDVDASGALQLAPIVVPVSAVQSMGAAEVLSPGYVRMNVLPRSLHGGGGELARDREVAGGGRGCFERILACYGHAASSG